MRHSLIVPCFLIVVASACAADTNDTGGAYMAPPATGGTAGTPGAAGAAAGTPGAAGTVVGVSGSAGTTAAAGMGGATTGGAGGMGGGFVVNVGGAGASAGGASGGGAGGVAQGGGGAGGASGGGAGGAAQGGGGAGGAAQGNACTQGRMATAMPASPMTGDPNADGAVASMAIDGNTTSRWASGQTQAGGEWIAVRFTAAVTLTGLVIDTVASPTDYPRMYSIDYSTDGTTFMPVAGATGVGMATTTVTFGAPVDALAIRINQTGMVEMPETSWWAVHEITFPGCMPAN